jgi:Ca-activated chloride channel family protein
MFDFAYPLHLYLLGLIVVFGLLYVWARASRARKLKKFGRADVIASLMPDASRYKPAIKITLQLLALAALVIVLARPRAGQKEQEASVNGIEIMIAFDVSNSMLASSNDAPDGTSRLSRARLLLEKMIDKLDNDKVGLIVFAGDAKTQLPLTTDFYSAKMYLNDLTPSMITFQGTDIAQAMKMAMNGFSPAEDVHKSIILITDAEDHEGAAIEAAKAAADSSIQVNVIGLGSAKGAPIPVSGRKGEYLRDSDGQVVTTSLNEDLAKQIAEAGNGIYVNGGSSSALNDLVAQLETLQKSEFKRISYTAGAEQFPTFAWIAFIILLIDLFVLDRKISWLKNVNFFSK